MIARRFLGAGDGAHPSRPDVAVGEVAQVEHVAPPICTLDDHAGALWVDRDHLGDVSVEPIGAVVVAGELHPVAGAEFLRDLGEASATSAPQRAGCQPMGLGAVRALAGFSGMSRTVPVAGSTASTRCPTPARGRPLPPFVNVSRDYARNGLNQYTSAGPASFGYDDNGNLTSDGTSTYAYDIENRLTARSTGAGLVYDPLGRLYETSVSGGNITRFLYGVGT